MSTLQFKSSKKAKLAGILLALGLTGQAQACSVGDPIVGAICTFAFDFCPNGFLPANGAELTVNGYQVLFSLLGTTYGGNGTTTFKLPDLRGRSAIGSGQGAGLTSIALGQAVGAERVVLQVANLAAHTHSFKGEGGAAQVLPVQVTVGLNASTAPSTSSTPTSGSMIAKVPTQSFNGGAETFDIKIWNTSPAVSGGTVPVGGLSASGKVTIPAGSGGGTVGAAGSNAPVPTRSPALALTSCIVNEGVYPNRQ